MPSLLRRTLSPLLLALSLGACFPSMQSSDDAGPPKVVVEQPQPEKKIDRAKLRAALAERRQLSFQRFVAYRDAGVYPENTYQNGALHVWLDVHGNLCAAATIIAGDWGRDATERVATEDNFIALADVKSGPLADWILTSGLTHAEIVAIQVPPMRVEGPEWQPEVDPRTLEVVRLYGMYVDIERQLVGLWEENLDLATDALMERPDLARALVDNGVAAGPGRFSEASAAPVAGNGFAQPPPA